MKKIEEILEEKNLSQLEEHLNAYEVIIEHNKKFEIEDDELQKEFLLVQEHMNREKERQNGE